MASSVRIVHEDATGIRFSTLPLVGLLFVAAGGGMAWWGIFRIEDDTFGRFMFGGIGLFFGLIGTLAALWRYELSLDLMSRTYRGRRGFWPSPKLLQGSFDELRGIVIERTRRSSSGTTNDHFSFALSLDFGSWSVRFFDSRSEEKAFARLERMARRMQVHVIDRTGPTETRSAWNELNRSVAETLRAKGETAEDPGPPPSADRILWDPSRGSISLPPLGFGIHTVAIFLFGSAFAAFGVMPLLVLGGVWDVPFNGSRAVGWVLGVAFTLFGLLLVFGSVWGSYAREVVREERDGLLFYLTLAGTIYRRRFLAKDEIEAISLRRTDDGGTLRSNRATGKKKPKKKHEIVLRAEGKSVSVGGDLRPDEQEWLVAALSWLATR